jgi:anti-sigma factor RsiW
VSGCEAIRPDLGAHALGALEPEEAAAVEAHVAGCAQCAAELARLRPLPALVARAEGLEIPAPPAALEERLLDRVAASRPRRHRRRMRRLAGFRLLAAALAGAALGAGATALAVTATDGGDAVRTYELVLKGTGGASARAQLEPNDGGTEVHLWVKGLPPGEQAVYEVRCERPGWSAGAGTFRAGADGKAYVVLTTAARMGEYESIRVVRGEEDVLTGSIN